MKTKKNKKIVIYDPKRFILFLSLLMVIISILIVSIMNLNKSYGQEIQESYEFYIVKKGDSLWSIVNNHYPEKYDPRDLVKKVKSYNSLNTNIIHEGDILKLPEIYD